MAEGKSLIVSKKKLINENDGFQPSVQECNNWMTNVVMTSSINVSQETIYKKRRGLLREYFVNRVI